MFSSINVWDHDPVKEITNKLTSGAFHKPETDPTEIYKFSQNIASESSLNLLSEDMGAGKNIGTRYSSCSPVKFKTKKKIKKDVPSIDFSEFENTSMGETTSPVTPIDSKCSYMVRHMSKCRRCYDKLNKLIDKKVKEKVNDMFLDANLQQLKTFNSNRSIASPPPLDNKSDSWKETMIIVVGAIIAILIIFLITKCFK
jgi:hypothetical protein